LLLGIVLLLLLLLQVAIISTCHGTEPGEIIA